MCKIKKQKNKKTVGNVFMYAVLASAGMQN